MATILELAELSAAAYGDPAPSGWTLLPVAPNFNSDGYFAQAYQNNTTHEIVITNRGTRPTQLADLLTDLNLATQQETKAENDAIAFAKQIANDPRYSGLPIIETGHSLGGSEAQAATAVLADLGKTVSAVTFNAPGIATNYVPLHPITSYHVLNLYDQGDAIHTAGGAHLGTSTMMPAGPSTSSLALITPLAVAAGPVGIAALLGAALWDVVGPAHSLNTVISYLNANPMGQIGWSATGLSSSLPISGTGASTGPKMTVNSAGALVLTDANGSVTLTASADKLNVIATFSGSGSAIIQQLAALGTVSIPVSELNQIVTGLTGASTINETVTRNPNNANTFDVAFQNIGAPNSGDQFKVAVANTGSGFNYVVPSNGQTVVETIDNGSNNSSGTVSVITGTSNTQLTGSTTAEGAGGIWTDSNGDQYQFAADYINSQIGTLTITQGLLGSSGADQIIIKNFDMSAAQNGGYLGIHLQPDIAIAAGTNPLFPDLANPATSATSVLKGNTSSFSVYGQPGSTYQLTCTGSGTYWNSTGATMVPFANGPVSVTIPAGQNYVTLTLIDTSTTNSADTASLTATLVDPLAPAGSAPVTSNTLAVTFDSPNPNAGSNNPVANTINGDLTPQQYTDSKGNTYYKTDANGNLITNGTPDPNFNDVLYGDGKNDVINTGGGINIVNGMGGNDTINGGPGNDIILGGNMNGGNYVPSNVTYTGAQIGLDSTPNTYTNNGGNGNNLINGGGGQDIIIVGNGSNQIYAGKQADLATALANQKTATASGLKGDLIAVGDGNNTIVGGNGNDAIFTGTGNNTIVCGSGAVYVSGGVEINSASLTWTVVDSNYHHIFSPVGGASAPYTPGAAYNGNTYNGVAVGVSNDTIFGGTGNSYYYLSNGNNWLDAGGGNDHIQAGVGSNTIFGGTGNDTIFGGGGGNYINLESGNDYVVLNGGNNTVIGGSGNDTIWSGDNTANWADSQKTANNYLYGGSGNSVILGSGGNDTLIGGTGNALIIGGNGNEYIVGGSGNVSIVGGNGNDTIYAGGNGNDTIYAWDGNATIYGGNGIDSITGGAGTDVISAGDGGTATNATQVHAGSGTSTLYGGAGVDQLFGGSGSDTLIAGTGTSTLTGGSGIEVMYGSIGNATLIAGSGADTLYGGGGTDVLQGGSGNTLFVAGSGFETITGGSGSNTYEFDAGFGNVELGHTKATDTFRFGTGISAADLTVSATIGSDGSSALLIRTSGGGQLTIDNGLSGAINQFVFAGGPTLTLNQLMAQAGTTPANVAGATGNLRFSASGNATLTGGAGNDTIYGWNGGNTLIAGSGNQTLNSVSGSDTLTAGTGNDTLVSAAGHDTLVGGTGNTTFVVDSATDVIRAQSTGSPSTGSGQAQNINTVQTSVSYVTPAHVRNLTGSGSAGITLTGNPSAGSGQALDNVITANSGNDTLIAGAGIATLIGGAGNDTFVVNNVNDVVQAQSTGSPSTGSGQAQNVNTVQTSVSYVAPANVQNLTGTGSANLTLTGNPSTGSGQALNNVITANSGNDTLVAGTGVATLIGGSGNDTFVVNNAADVILAQSTGGPSTGSGQAQNVNTVQTSVSYVAPANVQNLTGTGSANITLTGNPSTGSGQALNNVITANSGNDTLDGGTGNSTLYGGAGLDTFVMGYGMGTDTAIDTSASGGIVQLSPGLSLSALSAVRQGNDLLLQIDGSTTESMRIQGYYSHPNTRWTIKDGTGVSASPQSILDATAVRQSASNLAQAENDFIAHAKGELASSLLASGYHLQPDGTFYQPYQIPQFGRVVTTRAGQETQTSWNADGTLASSQTNRYSQTSIRDTTAYPYSPGNWNYDNWYNWYYFGIDLSDRTASIKVVNTASNTPVVYADSGTTVSQNYYTRWLQMSWSSAAVSSPYYRSTTYPYEYYTVYYNPNPTPQSGVTLVYSTQGPFWGKATTSDVGVVTQTTITGAAVGVLSDPGNLVATGTTPQVLQAQYLHTQTAYEIQRINLGAGNHTVYAGSNTLVNSSSGNDTIRNAGFAYGGTGNDTMIGGGTLVAGTGSDLLIGGNTMVAGSGSDQIFAGTGAATIQIDPNSVSSDLIGGAGNTISFLNAVYQSMGINDWEMRYMYGSPGMYWVNVASPGAGRFMRLAWQILDWQGILDSTGGNLARIQQMLNDGRIQSLDPLPVLPKVSGFSLDTYFYRVSPYYAAHNVPVISFSANDFQKLASYYAHGISSANIVAFGQGVLPSDLHLSWGQTVGSISGLSTDPQLRYTTLDLSWGTRNQSVRVMIPHSSDPLGSGVTGFTFANGTKLSMAQMIALAPPAPTFDPQLSFMFQPAMGAQTLPTGVTKIQFAAGMIPTSVSVTQNSAGNFVISYNNGASTLVIPAQSAVSSPVVASFANGTRWQFVNAAGNPYTYTAGSGVVYLINAAGNGTVQFGTGITPGMITLGIGSCMLRVGNTGDVLHIEGFSPADALNSGEIQTFKFADGTTLNYSQLLARGFDIYGTTGNETLTGTNLDNRIHAGTGNDVLIGSGMHDTLYGGAGNDTLIAGSGTDVLIAGTGLTTMVGGTGNDTFVVNKASDVVQVGAVHGNDTIQTSVSYTASANVQNLTGTGSADLTLTGNPSTGSGQAFNNVITANSGNDTLVAGSGVATLIGGVGSDTFVVNNVNDVVLAKAGSNVNTIKTSVSYVAPANVQNLTGTGSADITLTGNPSTGSGQALNNVITANSGNDTLIAGSGIATMIGGAGNDTFVVNNVNDVVIAKSTGKNVNTVLTSVNYVAPANVKNLTGTGSANITLTGNPSTGSGQALNNVITANSGNDTLIAGSGIATMVGGTGNDTFVVNNVNDVVQAQSSGNNVNTVLTSVNYVAPANVQNLTGTGTANLTLTGNPSTGSGQALGNTITANSGNDTLVAGSGVATMIGGSGNDTFVVNNANDVVQAQSTGSPSTGSGQAQNINTVLTSVNYVAPANVQNLTGLGSADLTLTGNSLDNILTANSGNDTLIGAGGNDTFVGGAGNDLMTGGTGNDTYVYNRGPSTGSGQAGLDTIVDAGGNNTIRLGAGMSYQHVVVRLTYADGTPYTVYANGSGEGDRHGGEDHRDEEGRHNSTNLIAHMMVLDSNGVEQASQGMDFAVTVDHHGNFTSPIQAFQFSDGSSQTFDNMLVKTETIDAEHIRGPVMTGRNDTIVYAGRRNTGIWLGTGNDTVYASERGSLVYAGGGNDYLAGSRGNDTFVGGWGVDVLQGGEGNNILSDLHGRGALLGGKGRDTITAGAGNDFIAGGRGNDLISTGATHNVIAFNKGDGRDTILATPGASNTLSLGGEVNYQDLSFSKNGNDLVLNESRKSSVTFKDWYACPANHDFVTLQIIGRQSGEEDRHQSHDAASAGKVNEFDFSKLVAMFDQAIAGKPSLNKWSLMDGLLNAHLASSDTAALGGDLAYVYGTHGSLSGMGLSAAQNTLKDQQFGTTAQTLHPWPTLNTGAAHIR